MTDLRENASRQAEEDLLHDSERPFHPAAENAPVAIACCDTETRYKFVNGYYAKRHGATPEQLIGKYVREVVGEQAWATFGSCFRECLAGKAVEFEVELRYPANGWQFVHCYYEPEWRDGKVVGAIAAITNTTCRKRAEQRLRESEATFRAMFDVSSVGKFEVAPESGRFLRANKAMCEFVGYRRFSLRLRSCKSMDAFVISSLPSLRWRRCKWQGPFAPRTLLRFVATTDPAATLSSTTSSAGRCATQP